MAHIQANIVKFQALLTDMRPGPSCKHSIGWLSLVLNSFFSCGDTKESNGGH